MNIAENLRNLRTERGISQTAMAKNLNISRQAYNHYETGKRIPPVDVLNLIAKILSVNIQYLIQDENSPISIEEADEQNKRTATTFNKFLSVNSDDPTPPKKRIEEDDDIASGIAMRTGKTFIKENEKVRDLYPGQSADLERIEKKLRTLDLDDLTAAESMIDIIKNRTRR